jgi:enterochelin esterase-like enzyme/inosine-uridine nucleoside N-ribohydrolase
MSSSVSISLSSPWLRLAIAWLSVTSLLCVTVAHADEPPAPVDLIFDTDIGNDVDDVLALGMIHALQSRGECRLLAVTITKDCPQAAAFTDAVNTFYCRGETPVGIARSGVTPDPGKFLPLAAKEIGGWPIYPHDLEGSAAPDAVDLLRKTLAARPDHSVVIAQVGFSTNLARLLDSPPDEHSPLSGRELAAQKVRLLSVMAGAFEPINGSRHLEYNVVMDIPSAKKLAAEWPTEILYSGFEIGLAMPYPAASILEDYRWHPGHILAESYVAYEPPPHNRPTWDLTSVLAVVRPSRGYFGLSEPGRVIVEDDGGTRFEPAADGRHRFLTVDASQIARGVEAFVNLCSEPVAAEPAADAAPTSDSGQSGTGKSGTAKGRDTLANGNVVIGPDYRLDPALTEQGNPKGRLFEFSMKLAESTIFSGTDATLDPRKKVRTERKIFVYVPHAYVDGTEAPILVTLDGPSQLDLIRHAVDNLTISKDPARRLPALIVISVENGGDDSKGSERGLEYDTMSDRFARFINDEVLPAVLANPEIRAAYPNLAFTDDPWGRGVMGCSSGGAAALTMGWFRPDLFRRLITYSGTFVDQQDDDAPEEATYPLGAWEYHSSMRLIENSEKKPLRIFTHVAEHDNGAGDPEETYHNWVMANERTAAALAAKGYDYRYVFSRGSRHCDGRVFEHTLADTLLWMWQDAEDHDRRGQ